jgi:caa(3)-type oxidase subunit IV
VASAVLFMMALPFSSAPSVISMMGIKGCFSYKSNISNLDSEIEFNIGIWFGLILLTIMTVLVSVMGINLVAFSVITALIIASAKAFVVANYFMNLKYDNILLKILFGITMLLFNVFLFLTAIDYLTR